MGIPELALIAFGKIRDCLYFQIIRIIGKDYL